MAIKCVIFDLDGTITEPLLDFEVIRAEIGIEHESLSLLEVMESMTDQQRKMAMEILERHEDLAAENSTLNRGARQILDLLKRSSISVGILTRNKKNNVTVVARKHGLHFDAIYAREDGPVKPDAYGVIHLCKMFGCLPSESLVVGDFVHDLMSAKAAGAVSVLIKTHKNADQFTEFADYSIKSLDMIPQIIEQLQQNRV